MAVSTQIAVIGVGNEFRHDDGFGWAVVDRLRERAADRPLPPGTVLAVCDGDPGRLIDLWENAALAVVLDAAHAHPAHPGRVHRLELEGAVLARTGTTSSHGLGLGEAVELSRVLGRLPEHLVVYAVEGADDSLGRGMSEPVAAQIAPVVTAVEDEIVRHRDAAARATEGGTAGRTGTAEGAGTAEGGGTPP